MNFVNLVRVGVLAGLLGIPCARAQTLPVLIQEVASREVSIHVGGVQTPECKDLASREVSVLIGDEPLPPYREAISREVSIIVTTPQAPTRVTQLTVSPSPTGESTTLSWGAYNELAERDVARYDIYMSTRGFTDITGMTPYASVPAGTMSITLNGLPAWQDRCYAVVAVDALGGFDSVVKYASAYTIAPEVVSREVSVFVGAEPAAPYREAVSREVSVIVTTPQVPARVTQLTVNSTPTGESTTLSWSAYNELAERDVARYDIYLSTRGFTDVTGMTPYASVPSGTMSLVLNGLPAWQDRCYAVVPVDALGGFDPVVKYAAAYTIAPEVVSREVSVFIGDEPVAPYREVASREVSVLVPTPDVPAPVTGLDSGFAAAQSTTAFGAIDLNWSSYNELAQRDVVRYRLYVGTSYFEDVSGMTPYAFAPAGVQRWALTGLGSLGIYYVAAVAEDTLGQWNNTVRSVSAQASVGRVGEVRSLSVVCGADSLQFNWLAPEGADPQQNTLLTGYRVYFDGATTPVVLDRFATSYTATGLQHAHGYPFRISAIDFLEGETSGTSLLAATWLDHPTTPATESFDGKVRLTWSHVEPNDLVKTYAVYVSPTDFSSIAGRTPTLLTRGRRADVSGLANGTRYYFAVTTVNVGGGEAPTVQTVSAVPQTRTGDFADLQLADLSGPATAYPGGRVAFGWRVANLGSVAASRLDGFPVTAWTDRIVLSRDAVLGDADDLTIANLPHLGGLAAGAEYVVNASVVLPRVDAGTYRVFVVSDAMDEVYEFLDAGDNTGSLTLSLAGMAADLVAGSLTAPASALPGQTVDLAWSVANTGTHGLTNAAWSEQIVVSNALDGAQTLHRLDARETLPPGETLHRTLAVALPATLSAGDSRFYVTVDSQAQIDELDEANNVAMSDPGTAIPLLLTLTVPASEIAEGGTLRPTLRRNGSRTEALTVTLTSTDLTELSFSASAAVATTAVTIPAGADAVAFDVWAPLDGVYDGPQSATLGAAADGYPAVSQVLTVQDVDLPKLTFTLAAASITEGMNLGATIVRDGPLNDPLTVTLNPTPEGRLSAPASITLPAGQASQTFSVLAIHDGTVQPDTLCTLSASAVGFETVSANVTVLDPGGPDLVIEQLTAPGSALPGQAVDLTWQTANRGGLGLTNAVWSERIAVSNAVDGLQTLLRLDVTNTLTEGAVVSRQQSLTLPAGLSAGDNRFVVVVDSEARVAEKDEANDTAVSDPPTAVPQVLTLTLPASQIAEGGTLRATLRRNGSRTEALVVTLTSSDATGLSFSASAAVATTTVTLPAGEVAADFAVWAPLDGLVDGAQTLTLSAAAGGYPAVSQNVTVSDVDVAQLTLSFAAASVVEGATVGTTVTRDGDLSQPLAVVLGSSSASQLSPPTSITIPVGQASWTFAALAVDDDLVELSAEYTLSASAPGFETVSAAVTVLDNDAPQVTVTLASATVSEGGGPQATYATVTRGVVSARALTVDLTSSDPNSALVPARVVIPANGASTSFPVAAVDNAQVDGPRTVTITPFPLTSGTNVRLPAGTPALLTVTDDDGPTLKLVAARKLVPEGLNPATTVTVTRNTAPSAALTVALSSSDTTEATVPPSVTIPAGEASADFPLASVADGVQDGNKTVTITALVSGYTSGTETVVVSDTQLPDLVVSQVTGPATAETDSYVNIGYRVANQGLGTAGSNFLTRVYLSTDPVAGNDTLIGQYRFDTTLPVGVYFNQTLSVRLPLAEGQYWVVVETDAEQTTAETLEDNNTAVSATPIAVKAGYGAWVKAGIESAPAGTAVSLSGRATNQFGFGAPYKMVNLHLLLRSTERVISALTDANGYFSTVWQPLANEAGRYQVFATHPGVPQVPVQSTFTLFGMIPTPGNVSFALVEQASRTGTIQLENPSEVPLTGLAVTVASQPSDLTVVADLGSQTSLPGLSTLDLNYRVTANSANGGGVVVLRVSCAEGATAEIRLNVSVEALRPRLVAFPGSLVAGMARGKQTAVEFDLVNLGGKETGPLTLVLPNVPWLALATTNPMPALYPGQTNRVTLLLTPAADLALGPYTGSLAVEGTGAGLGIPFDFRALSEAKGDLKVIAVDEYTYYAEGKPKLAGAAVTVRDAVSGTTVASGTTDANGEFFAAQLQEAYYDIEVTAEKHSGYRQTHLVLAGKVNEAQTFLSRQVVTTVWTVEPIEIEDRYRISVETTFETVVPMPVVTVEPAVIDLAEITADLTQREIKISNHGLIAANNTCLTLPTHPLWQFESIVSRIGTLPANSSVTVPLTIRRVNPQAAMSRLGKLASDQGPCSTAVAVTWELVCGVTNTYGATIAMPNAREGCGGSAGGGWTGGGGGGGGGGVFITSPGFSPPSVCDCSVFGIRCLKGQKSFNLPGIAEKVTGVLGKVLPPPFQLESVKVSIPVSGKLCVCCTNGHISGLEGSAKAGAGIEVVVIVGRGVSLPALKFTAEGWDEIKVEASALAGARLTGKGSVEGEYERDCDGRERLCASGSVSLNLYAGLEIAGKITAKSLSDQLVYSGEVSGQLGLEGEVSASVQGCSDTGFKFTACGEAWARAHLTAQVSAVTPFGDVKSATIGPNCDVPLLKKSCVTAGGGAGKASVARRLADDDSGPLVEEVPGNAFFRPTADLLRDAGVDPVEESGVCAKVKLRTEQDAVLTRNAFGATLQIDNSDTERLEDIEVSLTIQDQTGLVVTPLFGVRPPELVGLSGVTGSGVLAAQSSGTAKWTIIPTVDAAPGADSVRYLVSGQFNYTQNGTRVSQPLAAVPITVLPSPRLTLQYFHQRDVYADDPFTDVVEPSIPFNLALMVQNRGYGVAKNFHITSAQPKIVENEKGLLIDFQIIGTEVAGRNLTPSLTADFGNIDPGKTVVGRWLMTSTLQGLFTDYSATFEHIDGLGNKRLSLIDEVSIHEMVHAVQTGGAFEDGRPDFLVNDVPDLDDLPDTLYLSDGSTNAVQTVRQAAVDGAPATGHLEVQLTAPMPSGWTYLRVPEPSGGQYRLVGVRRSDGLEIALDTNVWVTDRTFIGLGKRPKRENVLHLLDYNSPGQYVLTYAPVAGDAVAPASRVVALPASSPQRIAVSWTGEDNDGGTGVASYDIYVSVDDGPFALWLGRTTLTQSAYLGTLGHRYAFYSVAVDRAGNRQAAPVVPDATTTVSIENRAPMLTPVADTAVDELTELTLLLSATDPDAGDTLTYSLVNAPAGMTLTSLTGLLRWTPTEADGPGVYTVTVRVQDNANPPASANASFTVTVREVNTKPVLGPLADAGVVAGELLTLNVSATDADRPANRLTFSLGAGAPAGVSIDPATGVFQWRPTDAQAPSTNRIPVTVTDDGQPPLADTGNFTVIVQEKNRPPTLTLSTAQTSYTHRQPGTPLDAAAQVADSDTPVLMGGLLSVAIVQGAATDDRLIVLEQSAGDTSITVTPAQELRYGTKTIGTCTGGTNDAYPLRVSLNENATLAAVQALVRTIAFTNESVVPFTVDRTLEFWLSDGQQGTSAPVRLTLSVRLPNTLPEIGAIPTILVAADNGAGPVFFTVSDAETPAAQLALRVTSSDESLIPAGNVVLGGTSGQRWLTVTPAPNRTGTATLTVTATDADGGSSSRSFTVRVTGNITARTFLSSAAITILASGAATPYPSKVTVSGMSGKVLKATVTLNNLFHTRPEDLSVLLVSPEGRAVQLMSHAGGANALTAVTLQFNDTAIAVLPDSAKIASGSYAPASYGASAAYPSPAPAGPYGSWLNTLIGTSPNGVWTLYVYDGQTPYSGRLATGWTLRLVTTSDVLPLSESPAAPASGGLVRSTVGLPLAIERLERLNDGSVKVIARANPGQTVTLEGSLDLRTWEPLQRLEAVSAEVELIDSAAGAQPHRYYRLVSP